MRNIFFIVIFGLFFTGCATNNEKTLRPDSQDINVKHRTKDLHIFVHKMVSSMLQSPAINVKPKKYIGLGEIKMANGVDKGIDNTIRNSIKSNLIKSRKINFINSQHNKDSNSNSLFSKDLLLTGDIHTIKKENQKVVDDFYALVLILTDVKTSKVVWTEEKKIQKKILY
jgi:PBP1b-binding outer membrane lipoprotein LpoB